MASTTFLWNLVLALIQITMTSSKMFRSLAENPRALPFFQAFTGCDTTTSFFLHGKCTFWDSWMNSDQSQQLTNAFIELSDMPQIVTSTYVDIIQGYLVYVHYPHESDISLTNLRLKYFFLSPDPQLRNLIISNDGLSYKTGGSPTWLALEFHGCE